MRPHCAFSESLQGDSGIGSCDCVFISSLSHPADQGAILILDQTFPLNGDLCAWFHANVCDTAYDRPRLRALCPNAKFAKDQSVALPGCLAQSCTTWPSSNRLRVWCNNA